MTVRRATPGDAEAIYRTMRRSRREAFDGLLSPATLDWPAEVPDDYRDHVRRVCAHDAMAQLVAVREDRVVGCAELAWAADETRSFVGSDEAELHVLHVAPDWRREGIGTRLVDRAAAVTPSNVTGLALGVLVGNDGARAFYERCGFDRDGTTTITLGGEAYTEAVYRRRS